MANTRKARPPKPPQPPPVKALLGRTECSDEDATGPSFFAVTLSPELTRLVAQRWLLWRHVNERDGQLYELQFWDHYVSWMDDSFNSEEHLPEEVVDRIDDEGDCVTLPAAEVKPYAQGDAYHARTECNQMCVGDNDIKWTCYPKHGSAEFSTGQIPLGSFLLALAEQELPGDPTAAAFEAEGGGWAKPADCAIFLDYLKEKGVLP